MQNTNDNNTSSSFHEYCTGVPSPSDSRRCLYMVMLYRPHDHPSPDAELTPIHYHHQSSEDDSASTPRSFPSYPPSPPSSSCSYEHSPRPTLPSLRTLFPSMGSAPSSPPPPYTALPSAPIPRFQVYHARYYGNEDKDSNQDHHKLFILTQPSPGDSTHDRGLYVHVTGSARRGMRFADQTTGGHPENTPALREATLLGTVSAAQLDALRGIGRRVHEDMFPVGKAGGARCPIRMYTTASPPPPYNDVWTAEPLVSPSQEWVAAVIDEAESSGVLQMVPGHH